MKLAIMQPYLFPYIGYWQLINSVDKFVIYDDVNYIKGGWINRNRILANSNPHLFTISLHNASSFVKIKDTFISDKPETKEKVISFIRNSYLKAPFFKQVFPIIKNILLYTENNLALYLKNQILSILDYLYINTEVINSSDIEKNDLLKSQDKLINICHTLNATQYINSIGGKNLYRKDIFLDNGINLYFIKTKKVEYKQFNNCFVPNLSIIDIMMFNSVETIKEMLNCYELE